MNVKRKLIYFFSHIEHSLGFEWLATYIDKNQFEVSFVFINPSVPPLLNKIKDMGLRTYFIPYRGKKDLLSAIIRSIRIIRKTAPDIVHAHLFEASFIAMTASWICGVRQRIYTRHHSTFHHVDHPSAVKYDKLINRLSTRIIAVSRSVAKVLTEREGVNPSKIIVVHHGFDLSLFRREAIATERIESLRHKYNPQDKRPVIGVISRYIHWKGLQYIIPAFKEVLHKHQDALLVLANARGNYKDAVHELLSELPQASYVEIDFENDIFALYQLFDVFVHTPVREDAEAFGQIYIEAMAAGICVVGTRAGIGAELLEHGKNAWVVPFCDSQKTAEGILTIIEDRELAQDIRSNALISVSSGYDVSTMIKNLEAAYDR